MKILCLTPTFQHPQVRGPHRYYHLVRELACRHEITLLTLGRSPIPDLARREMDLMTSRTVIIDAPGTVPGATRGPPSSLLAVIERRLRLRRALRAMRIALEELVCENEFDVVIFHGKSIYPVVAGWKRLPLVIDFCDATSTRILAELRYAGPGRRLRLLLRYARILRVERNLIRMGPHLAFVSMRDRHLVLGPGGEGRTVPIGVDTGYWRPARQGSRGRAPALAFHGILDYRPNADAALQLATRILPAVREKLRDAEAWIVGRDPSESLRRAADAQHGLTVTGFVTDIRPYLERASVYVAPVRFASGTQNKVLEAMAMELPVIASRSVVDGLAVEGGVRPPVQVAQDPNQVARMAVDLLMDRHRCRRLGMDGRRFVTTYFSWANSARVLEDLCRDAVAQPTDEADPEAVRTRFSQSAGVHPGFLRSPSRRDPLEETWPRA